MNIDENIENQYMPSRWSKRYPVDEVVKKHEEFVTAASNQTKCEIPYKEDIHYGLGRGQVLDIFGENFLSQDAEIFVYIHGGYWQSFNKKISSYCVTPLFLSNIKTIIPEYDLAPVVNMKTIVKEIKELADFVIDLAENCNSRGVWFGGHSAGAHLAAQLLNNNYLNTLDDNKRQLFKGVVLISGIYDLTPIIQTSLNNALNLTSKDINEYSPQKNLEKHVSTAKTMRLKVFVVVAENDSPEFIRQSKEYTQELKRNGIDVTYKYMKSEDHFSVVEKLNDSTYKLTKDIITLIKHS